MCCTSGPARLSDTLLYSGSALRNGKEVHVLAYQNVAESLTGSPNAMILPFPAAAPMDENNVVDTRQFPEFLRDISEASKIRTRSFKSADSFTLGVAGDDALVFDVGSYTVVLAEKASQIPSALLRVPEHKRPEVSTRFLIGFSKLYPEQPIAICCWAGYVKAEPLLWWYEPKNPSVLFAPTMDAHDGGAPNLEETVDTDHIVSVGSALSDRISDYNKVRYSESIPWEVRSLLPTHVHGSRLPPRMKNGDLFVDAAALKKAPDLVRGVALTNTKHGSFTMRGWH